MTTNQQRPTRPGEAPDIDQIGHSLTHLSPSRKEPVAALLRAILALVESTPEAPAVDTDTPFTGARIIELRPGLTTGWLRSHVPEAGRGARRTPLYLLSAVDRALASGAQPPRPPRKSRPITAENLDPIDMMIAAGELRPSRGSR